VRGARPGRAVDAKRDRETEREREPMTPVELENPCERLDDE
jgi:hypothetical protein